MHLTPVRFRAKCKDMKKPINLTTLQMRLGVNRSELAKLAGVDVSTVWRWEHVGIPKRGPARAFLEQLEEKSRAQAA